MSISQQNTVISASDELVSDADYLQLARLVTEHVWRVDNGHADTVFELNTGDAELALVGPEPLRGRDAIREWGLDIASNPPWNTIRHVVSDMHFVNDGPDAGHGTHLVTAFMDADGTRSSVPWNLGEDHDRFVRTEEGWRIASRSFVSLFERGDTIDIPSRRRAIGIRSIRALGADRRHSLRRGSSDALIGKVERLVREPGRGSSAFARVERGRQWVGSLFQERPPRALRSC